MTARAKSRCFSGFQWNAAICLRDQADQRIAAAQGVVEERERMVLGQRRQPERQLGQVHGHRVLVHAVQAPLGDEPAGVEDFVLIGRNASARYRARARP